MAAAATAVLAEPASGRGLVYSHEVYDALPTIRQAHDSLKSVEATTMECVAKIFVEHGVHEYLGLTLLHRHFDMSPDERLVEEMHPDGPPELYSFCTTCTGHDVVTKSTPVHTGALGLCSAHSWVLREDGGISAYEFQSGDHPVSVPQAFLLEVATFLSAAGLLGIFGLHAMHRPGKDKEGVLIEINDPEGRMNIVTNVPPKEAETEPVTHVLWAFAPGADPDGPPIVMLACHCSGKCRAFNH
jgi:hypothetical protein